MQGDYFDCRRPESESTIRLSRSRGLGAFQARHEFGPFGFGRRLRAFPFLIQEHKDTIQLRLSLSDLAHFHERLELLFHPLGDEGWIASADRLSSRTRFDARDLFRKSFYDIIRRANGR